MRNQRTNKENQ